MSFNPIMYAFFLSIFVSGQTWADQAEYEEAAEIQANTASRFPVPTGFEPGFSLSNEFPETVSSEVYSWNDIDFKSAPEEFMNALLAYVIEGNEEVDWRVGENATRTWYHAPWMHFGRRGREPIRGLTQERGSRPFELHPDQTDRTNNWAVGFYNSVGGVTLGDVWANPAKPNTKSVTFAENTVSAKLLFTDADVAQVPFLENSLVWKAQIRRGEAPVEMRLLQLDFAVRDGRADETTGWVFGTFAYQADAEGETVWERMIPVGLHWGNDQNRVENDYDLSKPLSEGWMNPDVTNHFYGLPRKWLGLWGRMNGPVDNPSSACLACHARAIDLGESTKFPPFTPNPDDQSEVLFYFKNRTPSEPYYSGFRSLDYSLQLADGVANFREWVRSRYPEFIDDIYNTPGAASSLSTALQLENDLPAYLKRVAPMLVDEVYESPFSRGQP